VIAQTTSAELTNISRLGRGFGSLTVVQVDTKSQQPARRSLPPGATTPVIRVTPDAPFGPVWDRAIAVSRQGRIPVGGML
jgi:hypothetical protein